MAAQIKLFSCVLSVLLIQAIGLSNASVESIVSDLPGSVLSIINPNSIVRLFSSAQSKSARSVPDEMAPISEFISTTAAALDTAFSGLTETVTSVVKDIYDLTDEMIVSNDAIKPAVRAVRSTIIDTGLMAFNASVIGTRTALNTSLSGLSGALVIVHEQVENVVQRVLECAEKNNVKDVPLDSLFDLASCVTDKISEANDIVVSVITNIVDAQKNLKQIPEKISNCTYSQNYTDNFLANVAQGSTTALCLTGTGASVATGLASTAGQLTFNGISAARFIVTLQSSLESCAALQVLQITAKVGKIGIDVAACSLNLTE